MTPSDDEQERYDRMKQGLAELEAAMDTLRVEVKYLVFDLEATQRENAYLRKLLSDANGGDFSGEVPRDET